MKGLRFLYEMCTLAPEMNIELENDMFSIIVARSENLVIGNKGKIPWHLPSDLKRFKNLTFGHTVVMGRKTHESIASSLPGRNKIVLSTQEYVADDCTVVNSLKELIQSVKDDPYSEIFVIGGSQVYELLLPLTQKLYVTTVHTVCNGDSFFPEINPDVWRLMCSEYVELDEKDEYCSTFSVFERRFFEQDKIAAQ